MSTPEQAVKPESDWHDVTVTLDSAGKKAWRVDGMLHRIVEIAGHALGRVRSMADRGPDDYAREDEERVVVPVRWLDRMMRQSPGGHGSVNGSSSKLLNWLVTLNIAVTVAVSSWIVSNVIEQGKQIAVLTCQLNPQSCPQVQVPRGSP